MATDSIPAVLILRALRIKGVVDEDGLGRLTGLAPEAIAVCIGDLSASGLAVSRTGRFAGWALTASGRKRCETALTEELSTTGRGDEVRLAYDRFLPLNDTFKSVCTAWQVRDLDNQVLNDHEDPAYDAEIVGRLGQVHDAAMPIVIELAGILSRFERYGIRLGDAYRRVQAGERDAFARPLSESYHDVWMELHEDLLLTLDIRRSDADA